MFKDTKEGQTHSGGEGREIPISEFNLSKAQQEVETFHEPFRTQELLKKYRKHIFNDVNPFISRIESKAEARGLDKGMKLGHKCACVDINTEDYPDTDEGLELKVRVLEKVRQAEARTKAKLKERLEGMEKKIDEKEHERRRFNEECICDICDNISYNQALSDAIKTLEE